MASYDPEWESLRKFRYTVPHCYREICINHLSQMLDLGVLVSELKAFVSKTALFDENKNVHGDLLVTHQMVFEIEYLIQQLKKNNNRDLKTPLLFRKPGSKARCNQLRVLLAERRFAEIELGDFTPCDIAGVLKTILQDPKEPLLTSVLYLTYCQVHGLIKSGMTAKVISQAFNKQCSAIQILFLLLPEDNYMLMRELLFMLHQIHNLQEYNQMDAHSLAVCLAPSLVCPREFTVKEFQKNTSAAVSTLKFMIENAPDLFVVPKQLVMDIKRHMQLMRIGHPTTVTLGRSSAICNNLCNHSLQTASTLQPSTDNFRRFNTENYDEEADCTSCDEIPAMAVYKKETLVQKSRSIFTSPPIAECDDVVEDTLLSRKSSRGKWNGFLRKFFPEKQPWKTNNSATKTPKRWSWLPGATSRNHNKDIPSNKHPKPDNGRVLGSDKYHPSCADTCNQVKPQNVVPGYLKVQSLGKIETRFSIADSCPARDKQTNGHKVRLSRRTLSISSMGSIVVRKGTFVVGKRSFLNKKRGDTFSRRHSTYLVEGNEWMIDSLPSAFNSDSDLDDVFSDHFHKGCTSTEEQDFQEWIRPW